MKRKLRKGITRPSPQVLAEIERQKLKHRTPANLPSRPSTLPQHPSPASLHPASPPIAAVLTPNPTLNSTASPTPNPIPQQTPAPPQPPPLPWQEALTHRRTLRTYFDRFALYGLAGEAVRALAPHTEAEPEAILLQLLAAFGNILGPGPHCRVGATRHTLNLFVVLVGESSKARKGTSWNHIAALLAEVDRTWAETRVTTNRLTARNLIGIMGQQQGDRRLLVLAEELASVLHTMGRSRTHLSPLLRCAWDSETLRLLERNRVLQASGGHLSLIGHITPRELADSLHRTEAHNGFANRCLWACVERSQCLPDGGQVNPDELSAIARRLSHVIDWAQAQPDLLFRRDPEASAYWNRHYESLSQADSGLRGAATGRAEAQVLRLSALYAALDCSSAIRLPHLDAAFALWDFCSHSALTLFGTCVGDSIADRILEALQAAEIGLTRKQIHDLFHGNISSSTIDQALDKLSSLGAATSRFSSGRRGRPATIWSAIDPEHPEPLQKNAPGESFESRINELMSSF